MKFLLLITLLFSACSSPKPSKVIYHAPPANAEAQKMEMRLKAVEMSQAAMKRSGMTAKVEGVNNNVLVLTSSRLTNAEMVELLSASLTEFRDIGFKTVVLTDKTGETRTVDLELFRV